MAEIDDLLGASLKRLAHPGDAAGVADAIRSRVDAGDTGTPASSSGFGGGILSWLPWLGVIVVAGAVGTGGGVAGLAGHPRVEEVLSGSSGAIVQHVSAARCVNGPIVAQLRAGERVLATARSEDSAWLGVRNPVTLLDTVWLPAGAVTVDDGQADLASLPVGGACPTSTVAVDPPPVVAAPVAPPGSGGGNPGGGGGSPAAPDTTAPSIGQGSASPNPIHQNGFSPDRSTVTVSASDNVGVTSVTATWAAFGPNPGGSASLSPSGNSWSFVFGPAASAGATYQVPITITARDAAGNQSSTVVQVTLQYLLV